MSYLILVRHTAVSIDPARPSHTWPVSETGRRSARKMAMRLAPLRPTRILTSTEAKASVTGVLMAEALQLPWTTAPGLEEQNRRGAPYLQDKAAFAATIAALLTRRDELIFGNETGRQARARFETVVQRQIAAFPDDTLLLVSHGTVITLFLGHHNPELDPIAFWHSLTLPWAGVVSLPDFKLQQQFRVDG